MIKLAPVLIKGNYNITAVFRTGNSDLLLLVAAIGSKDLKYSS